MKHILDAYSSDDQLAYCRSCKVGDMVVETWQRCCERAAYSYSDVLRRGSGVILEMHSGEDGLATIDWSDYGSGFTISKYCRIGRDAIRVQDAPSDHPRIISKFIRQLGSDYESFNAASFWTILRHSDFYIAFKSRLGICGWPSEYVRYSEESSMQMFRAVLKVNGYIDEVEQSAIQLSRAAAIASAKAVNSDATNGEALRDNSSPEEKASSDTGYAWEEDRVGYDEENLARFEEYDNYKYWSGDPDWDD